MFAHTVSYLAISKPSKNLAYLYLYLLTYLWTAAIV